MNLTLGQALKRGIDAHKAGRVGEANRYYTAILKAHPKHPDANHNMGVLAVGIGKMQEALPLFETALEANPSVSQFWTSYIETLIKLNKMDDAEAALERAKSNGMNNDNLDQLCKKLRKYPDPVPSEKIQAISKLYSDKKFDQVLQEA